MNTFNKILTSTFLCLVCLSDYSFGQPLLKEIFKKDFYVGCALNGAQIFGKDTAATNLATKQFNTTTPENILKWEVVEPRRGKFDFVAADKYVEFGQKNNMFIIGHTLVWHSQTPKWVFEDSEGKPTTRDTLLKRMKEHIFMVVKRYKGKIKGWDVVNEAVDDNGELRKSKWLEIIGEDFIAKAFEYAREADPNAELYYNDYSLFNAPKRDGVVRMVRNLQAKGIKVDAIGEQGHWALSYPQMKEVEATIVAFSGLGVKVMITELDISVLPNPGNNMGADISQNYALKKELDPYALQLPDSIQNALAKKYADAFELFLKYSGKISRVTFWGINDADSWLNNWPVKGRTSYPMLFDRKNKPKPAFDAVVKVGKERKK